MCPWGADFLPLHATPKVVMLAGWALSRWHHERAPNLTAPFALPPDEREAHR